MELRQSAVRRPGVLQGRLASLRIQGVRQIRAVRRELWRLQDLQIRPSRYAWDVSGVGRLRKSRALMVRQGSAVPDLWGPLAGLRSKIGFPRCNPVPVAGADGATMDAL